MNSPVMIRMDEETRAKAEQQASKLGLNVSEYIRLIINLDAATEIISHLQSIKELVPKLEEKIKGNKIE